MRVTPKVVVPPCLTCAVAGVATIVGPESTLTLTGFDVVDAFLLS